MARKKDPLKSMSLGGHLKELRNRLFWSALFIAAGAVGGWYLFDPVFAILQEPIIAVAKARGGDTSVNFPTVGGAFDLRIQVSIFLGLLVSSPFWIYNLWRFITPALKKKERRYTVGFLVTAIPLFAVGCYIAWISLPAFVTTLLSLTPAGSANVISATEYVLFTLRILLVFGIAFLIPVILVLLNFIGIISSSNIFKSWRMAIFLAAVISALATPTADPTSRFLLMVPLMALYFLAGAVAKIRERLVAKRRKAEFGDLLDISTDINPDDGAVVV